LLAVGAAALALLTVAPAAGAVTWTQQSIPAVQAANGQLFSVSCASSSACNGVGFFINSLGEQRPMAETWNGTSWALRLVPMPTGVPFGHLRGVSCTSATACTAVGATGFSDFPSQPLAERWNGTSWTIQPVPSPANTSQVQLTSVSCTSPTACTAVGGGFDFNAHRAVAVAERWNGASWSAQTIPNPSTATAVLLNGVSCTGPSACTAVGHYATGTGAFFADQVLAERWNGTTWTVQTTPLPSGTADATLGAVSCSAASACTAVGGYATTNSFPNKSLALRWNGSTWTIQATPNPTSGNPMLSGVSCPTATSCTAVGAPIETFSPVIEKWNGTAWTLQNATIPAGKSLTELAAVSCTAATACTAVGGAGGGSSVPQSTLAERSNGTSWSIQTTSNLPGALPSDINGVSCSTATACVAVGSVTRSTGQRRMLAEGWNGTSWTVQSVPGPATSNGVFNGVSCSAPTACTAVGSDVNASFATVSLAERWNGTSWVAQSTPAPAPAGSSQVVFRAVSCPTATSCTAVGSFFNSTLGHTVPLAEQWNGTTWTIKPTPSRSGATFGRLNGVSCSSPTSCTAVGGYSTTGAFSADKPLAEQWNGTTWTIKTTPSPAGATFATFTGVSCSAATACTAAGGFATTTGAGFPSAPLAERWNGSSWTVQTTPNPSSQGFGADSCPGPTACTGIGSSFAEGWDGTAWATQPLPFVSLGEAELFGVSCTATTVCTATGRVVENYFTYAVFTNNIFIGQMFTPLGERSS
jgi:hypothetical protein